ncbi:metal-dependent hydrolase [Natronococcus jeotgali]|uniref:Membrane-bound metal-dependent hydrolase n=1 Tax=Natronococcus jeotgali DSM 18795 TaxID=1227498 RepID=L9XLX5_9EURY|nr:metal-dependent hydrolase [Natronococcus jeotgali]ELY61663.1 hypothetical protein C492_09185 [Natronococcus jeotgali DSM 18795]
MVDVSGHFAITLLFAAPAWLLWGRRGALGFTAFALVTAMLPDSDLVLQHYLPVTHHGVTHTVLFVALVSVLSGAVAARWLTARFNAHQWIKSTTIPTETMFVFATAGMLTGGLSHIFGDLLSAPDIAAPLAPFWPVYTEHIIIDVIYYNSLIWNFGLLAVAIALHFALARHRKYPLKTRYRIGERDGNEITSAPKDGR